MGDRAPASAFAEAEATDREAATPLDVIVVGAGICGVILLKYARDQGLRCLALEQKDDVGGLWAWLPAWQDIQNRRQDYAVNGVPLHGPAQPDIHQHVREWVRRYGLAPFIRFGCEVTSVSWADGEWQVETTRGTNRTRYLIVASGVQNEPWIPDVRRTSSEIVEMHSCRLHDTEDLAGRRVTVVGGGASSLDLLELAIANGAENLHWVYRSIRWFQPTGRTKQESWPNLRELGIMQTVLRSSEKVNRFTRRLLHLQFKWHGLAEIEPGEPFDFARHQLIPGRRRMIRGFDSISRHQSEVDAIERHDVVLGNGERVETDVLLWGTGYRMKLDYLGLPEYREIDTPGKLRPRLGSFVRSVDYPNLFFVGMGLIDSTSSTPFFAAIEAKSIVAHILGRCEIPVENIPHVMAYWDVLRLFASFDHANYPRRWWRISSEDLSQRSLCVLCGSAREYTDQDIHRWPDWDKIASCRIGL